MAMKPIFVATHPRSCSTAYERVFMTRRDTLHCIHEPFGDAYYYGPERLNPRYEDDEAGRDASGFAGTTYQDVLDGIDRESAEAQGKRVFVKDIAHYLLPLDGVPASIVPSVADSIKASKSVNGDEKGTNGAQYRGSHGGPYGTSAEPGNPTVLPRAVLEKFHFTFLIRHPRHSIPSYYRCVVPPLSEMTGWKHLTASEMGYAELRRLFDYLRDEALIGPHMAGGGGEANGVSNGSNGIDNANGQANGHGGVEICLIDADDLLDKPKTVIEAFCRSVGIAYDPSMLEWETDAEQEQAEAAFAKWNGFHEDALNSTGLKSRLSDGKRAPKKAKTDEEYDADWTAKFGVEEARFIRDMVDQNVADYEYLKQFALKV